MSASAAGGLLASRAKQEVSDALNPDPSKVQNALSAIAAYIPSEGLSVYIAGMAIVLSTTTLPEWSAWLVFIVAFLVNFGITWYQYSKTPKDDAAKKLGAARLPLLLAATGIAFVLYILSIPENPFTLIGVELSWGGLGAVLIAPILAGGAILLGLRPRK